MTDTEAPSLLPCPFCGGAAKIIRTGSIGDRYIRVQCVSCGTSVGETRITLECINAWNHRTPPSSALGEEIRKLARELREKATNQLADLSVCSDANMADRKQFNDDCAMWGDFIRLCNAVLGEEK